MAGCTGNSGPRCVRGGTKWNKKEGELSCLEFRLRVSKARRKDIETGRNAE